jgi:hypothetical protein
VTTTGIAEVASARPRNHVTSSTEITETTAPAPWSTACTGRQVSSRRTRPPTVVAMTWPITARASTAHSEMVETTSEDWKWLITSRHQPHADQQSADEADEGHHPDDEALPVSGEGEADTDQDDDQIKQVHGLSGSRARPAEARGSRPVPRAVPSPPALAPRPAPRR